MAEPKSDKRGPTAGDVRMTFDMPEKLRQRLRIVAAHQGVLMKDLLLRWTAEGVEVAEKRLGLRK